MDSNPPPGLKLGALRPESSLESFQQRKLLKPSFRWQSVWQEEHARAFAVAGVMRLDILKLIRDRVGAALVAGTSMEVFREGLRGELVKRGFWGDIEVTDPETGELRTTRFDNRRLQLIFDVNMRQSHAAGRWARAMASSSMTHLVYRTMGDERVRMSHRPWDWVALPKDHPWWDTHLPPNGWRCRCHFYATDERGIRELIAAGRPVKREPPPVQLVPFTNKATGQTQMVPRGIDPGFAYNPGKVHVNDATRRLAGAVRAIGAPPPVMSPPVMSPPKRAAPVPPAPRPRTTAVPSTPAPSPAQAAPASRAAPRPRTAAEAAAVMRAVVARGRRERAFADFLRRPPPQAADDPEAIGLPVAVQYSPGQAVPAVVQVAAEALAEQVRSQPWPRLLPVVASGWALAQAVLDQGRRVDLSESVALWFWDRGDGAARRVHVLELQRTGFSWWVRALMTLSADEARERYGVLASLL
jgi:hypothetical protein